MAEVKRTFILSHATARANAVKAVQEAPEGYAVQVKPPTRNLDQNAAQWPVLDAFSEHLEWPVNGVMQKLSSEEWKDVLTATFRKETTPRLAAGLDGGVVMLGMRTSKMTKAEFSDWLEFLHAVAAIKGVELKKSC